jgi:hypothetical protein
MDYKSVDAFNEPQFSLQYGFINEYIIIFF